MTTDMAMAKADFAITLMIPSKASNSRHSYWVSVVKSPNGYHSDHGFQSMVEALKFIGLWTIKRNPVA